MTAIAFPTGTTVRAMARADAEARRRPVRPLPAAVYRRRRAAALILVVSVAAGGSAALRALGGGPLTAAEATSAATGESVRLDVQPVARSSYVVRPGDTMWTIARRLQPSGDVRPLVDRLMAERGGRALQPGERIVLP